MSDETLLSAARRLVRFVRINDAKDGGLLTIETLKALLLLDEQIRIEEARLKAARAS